MTGSGESEARKALARFARALEKARRELDGLEGALHTAEGEDFPESAYREARSWLERAETFAAEEGSRLQAKILETGGLEPGRIRRTGGMGPGPGSGGGEA